jgi:chromosomal replication initiator protein
MFWQGVVRRLGEEVPSFVLDAWIRPLVAETRGDELWLLCPSALHRERVRQRYLRQITEFTALEAGHPVEIELDIAPETRTGLPSERQPSSALEAASPAATAPVPAATGTAPNPAPTVRKARPPVQYSFDNFVVGPCNRLAREASFAVSEGRQQPVNPLYLTSNPGLGKTHLARAISEAQDVRGSRVIYRSAETFTNQFTAAIRDRKMDQFKRRYRQNCDVLVVEDLQFLTGKKGTQLELFHTLNHLLDIGARVVLTGDRLPREIAGLDERLCSHMSAGLVASLEPPDALVRRDILRVKAARGGVHLPDDCLDLLVDVVRGNVRDLEGALVQLVSSASLLKRPIDVELTESALRKLSSALSPSRRLTIRNIVDAVASFYRTSPELLSTRSRRRDTAVPRQIAMYLCRRYTNRPASEIARAFGRKHPSVTNAEKAVEKQMLENAPFRYRVEALAARLDELERTSETNPQ